MARSRFRIWIFPTTWISSQRCCRCWFLIMDEEPRPLGLTINWSKTNIQTMLDPASTGNQVIINGHSVLSVEVVESFPYLGSLIHCTGYRSPKIKRRVSITRDCMMALDHNIWRSRFSVGTKLRLYNSCILPIFLYGAETWAVTATAAKIRCS